MVRTKARAERKAVEFLGRKAVSPGVRRLLGDDAAPIPVPDDVVLYLQERQSPAGIIERPASQADRVGVLLTLIRTPLAVEAPIDDLEQT